MYYISAPEQNPLRINYRVYFHHDNKTSPSARMWLMAQIKRSIITFLWIFDHCIRAVTGSQICWTVFITAGNCPPSWSAAVVFTGLWGVSHEDRNPVMQKGKNIILREVIVVLVTLTISLLTIKFNQVVNTSHFRLTRFFVRGRCVCVCGLHELLACVCFYMHTLTAVESLEARVISRFPFMPNTAGTRMRSSVTSWNTSQFCHESTRSKTHHRVWITLNTTRRTANHLYS